jgi:chromate transporter
LFVLPSALLLLGLSWLYIAGSNAPWMADFFHGLAAAVIALVFGAVPRLGRKALKTRLHLALAAVSFLALQFFHTPFPAILLLAAAAGWMSTRNQTPAVRPDVPDSSWRGSLVTTSVRLALWWTPVLGVVAWLGWQSTPARMGLFFSQAAVVTFGGAYAVLPYVARHAVETQGWLTGAQMVSGLALAETTPVH